MTQPSELPLAETIFDDDELPGANRRDRIVILGRRTAGKTVYLATLYEKYWKSLHGLTMKALSGNVHSDLVRVAHGLRQGEWPPATLETQHCDLEIKYKGRRQLLVALDYAGELFRRAFVEDATNSEETAALVRHIDSAAAVLMLIDPAVVHRKDVDALIDDDFGMTQAVTRIRNWPGGKDVPFVLVFTKADENQQVIHEHGGLQQFVKQHYPALARTLKRIMVFQISATKARRLPDGQTVPTEGEPWQIEKPLLYCLDEIDHGLEMERQHTLNVKHQRAAEEANKRQRRSERMTMSLVITINASILIIAAAVIALLWYTSR